MLLNRRHAAWALLVTSALVGGPNLARAQEPDQEFRNGVKAFEEGRFEEAEGHFRNVLKSRPSHEQALRYRDEAGYHFWVRVLAKGDRLGTVARRILKSAEEAAIRERQDLGGLRDEMRGLWADDFMTEIETTEKLIAKYGHYVVPELVAVLSDRREDDKRVRAVSLLSRLGDEGTLAVLEMLESDDITLQQNAAAVLGHIRDIRAVPGLKRLAEQTKDPHVKEAATTAISRIEAPDFPTAEFYARIAEEFYRENPLFIVNRYREHVVWKWQDGRITRRDVAGFRWNEEVAEEFCFDGLSVDPEHSALWTLLLNVYAQQWCEIEESTRAAQAAQDRGIEVDGDETQRLEDMKGQMAKAKTLVAARGAEGVLSALGKALADQKAPVAVFLIERLVDLNVSPELLAAGGTTQFLPEAERAAGAAARPAPPPPPPPPPAGGTGASGPSGPKPTRVTDDGQTPPPPRPRDEEPPPLDDDEPPPLDGEQPRRRPRRVSQAPGGASDGAVRLGFVAPFANLSGAALGATGVTGEHPTGGAALAAALGYGDKRVRYAAAIALAHLNPAAAVPNAGAVMTNLVDALGESGQRVVLVVERDRARRNRIVGLLRELGYMTFGVESGREGLVRAKTFPSQDLILVSSELNVDGEGDDPIELQFIDMLKDDYRTKHVKVMVMAPDDRQQAMQGLVDEGKALDVIDPEIDRATLADKLQKAFGEEVDQRDEKSRSNAIAERAARAIASLRPGHTQFDITQAAQALAANVKRDAGRPDPVRLACLAGLSAIGPAARGAALDTLVREFGDDTTSAEVKRALAAAIGECVKGGAIGDEAFRPLLDAFGSDDLELANAAGVALGKAKLTGAQALAVFKAQRPE